MNNTWYLRLWNTFQSGSTCRKYPWLSSTGSSGIITSLYTACSKVSFSSLWNIIHTHEIQDMLENCHLLSQSQLWRNRDFNPASQPRSRHDRMFAGSLFPISGTVLPNLKSKISPPSYCSASAKHRYVRAISPAPPMLHYTPAHYRPPCTPITAASWTSTTLSLHLCHG